MVLARAMRGKREIGNTALTRRRPHAIPAAILALAVSEVTTGAALRAMVATVPKDMLELIHVAPLPWDWRVLGFVLSAALGLFRLLASQRVCMRIFDLAVFGAGLLLVGSAALARDSRTVMAALRTPAAA
jgi:hypothetical protein